MAMAMAMVEEAETAMPELKVNMDKKLLAEARVKLADLVELCERVVDEHECTFAPECDSEEITNGEACALCQLRAEMTAPPE